MSSRAEQLKQLWETMADLRGIVQEIERFQIECSFKQVRNTSINAVMIQVSDELWGIFGRLEAVRDALDEELRAEASNLDNTYHDRARSLENAVNELLQRCKVLEQENEQLRQQVEHYREEWRLVRVERSDLQDRLVKQESLQENGRLREEEIQRLCEQNQRQYERAEKAEVTAEKMHSLLAAAVDEGYVHHAPLCSAGVRVGELYPYYCKCGYSRWIAEVKKALE